MQKNCLISWLGFHDFETKIEMKNRMAPLEALLFSNTFDFQKVIVLDDQQNKKDNWHYESFKEYLDALRKAFPYKKIESYQTDKFNAADINAVFRMTENAITNLYNEGFLQIDDDLSFNTTSGTDIMKVCWTLISIAKNRASLLQSWYDKKNDVTKCEKYVIPLELDIKLKRMKENLKKHEESYLDIDSKMTDFINKECSDPKINAINLMVDKLSCYNNVNVLILGETGTGKGYYARKIYEKTTKRKNNFVEFNISAISETLIESELFGHVKGAFTGADKEKIGLIESANGGTLFIDEIGDLPETSQVKLLRAIQEKKIKKVGSVEDIGVDVRIISATHSPQKLRPDLYYRLADVVIDLPPLRTRTDVIEIAKEILTKCNNEFKKMNKSYVEKVLNDEGQEFIKKYLWKGNIRELQFVIKRCCFNSDDIMINKTVLKQNVFHQDFFTDLPDTLHFPIQDDLNIVMEKNDFIDLDKEIAQIRFKAINCLLNQYNGKQNLVAEVLKITPQALSKWLKDYHNKTSNKDK